MKLDDDDLIAALDELKTIYHARAMETFNGDMFELNFTKYNVLANKIATLRNKLYTGTVIEVKRNQT